jgi:hypothetical protein
MPTQERDKNEKNIEILLGANIISLSNNLIKYFTH